MKLSTSQRKKFRIRNKLKKYSSVNRYRLTVSRSSKNISAQIIDDFKKITLLSATSNQKSLKKIEMPHTSAQMRLAATQQRGTMLTPELTIVQPSTSAATLVSSPPSSVDSLAGAAGGEQSPHYAATVDVTATGHDVRTPVH